MSTPEIPALRFEALSLEAKVESLHVRQERADKQREETLTVLRTLSTGYTSAITRLDQMEESLGTIARELSNRARIDSQHDLQIAEAQEGLEDTQRRILITRGQVKSLKTYLTRRDMGVGGVSILAIEVLRVVLHWLSSHGLL